MATQENGTSPVQEIEDSIEVDIIIHNVVCSFSVRCHLNLRKIALHGNNVELRRENSLIIMKLREPYTTATIWSNGTITCTGATSEGDAKIAARRFARSLQKLGFPVKFDNFRIVNVLGTCTMPFGIRIIALAERHRDADYEPELHPGVIYKLESLKATLTIYSTGSITVTASSVADVQSAIEFIYPLLYEVRIVITAEDEEGPSAKKRKLENSEAPASDQEQPLTDEDSDGSSD